MFFQKGGELKFRATIRNKTAYLDGMTIPSESALSANQSIACGDELLWHRRLAHINRDRVHQLVTKEVAIVIKLKCGETISPTCEACIAGKQSRHPFPNSESKYSSPLELVVSDLHGKLSTKTRKGATIGSPS